MLARSTCAERRRPRISFVRLGPGQSRNRKVQIARAKGAAIACNLVLMDFENLRQRQEIHGLHLFRQPLEVFGILAIRLLKRGMEGFLTFWIGCGAQHQDLAVGRDVERRIGVGPQQIQNRFLDIRVHSWFKGLVQDFSQPRMNTNRHQWNTTTWELSGSESSSCALC